MIRSNKTLLAFALAAALTATAAYADKPANAGSNGNGNTTAAPTSMPPQGNPHDAMNSMPPDKAMASNANTSHDNMKDEAQYPPGKGNWWKSADANGDGLLTSSEAAGNAFLTTNFAAIDSNGDGLVSQEEYRIFYTNTASQGHH